MVPPPTHTSVKLINSLVVEGIRVTPEIQVAGYWCRAGSRVQALFERGSSIPRGAGRNWRGFCLLGSISMRVPTPGISLRSLGTTPLANGPTAAVDPVMNSVGFAFGGFGGEMGVSQKSQMLRRPSFGSGWLNPQSRSRRLCVEFS